MTTTLDRPKPKDYYTPEYIEGEGLSWENHDHRVKAAYNLDEIIPGSGGYSYSRCRCGAWRLEDGPWQPGAGADIILSTEECREAVSGIRNDREGIRAAAALAFQHAGLSPDCPNEASAEMLGDLSKSLDNAGGPEEEIPEDAPWRTYRRVRMEAHGIILNGSEVQARAEAMLRSYEARTGTGRERMELMLGMLEES